MLFPVRSEFLAGIGGAKNMHSGITFLTMLALINIGNYARDRSPLQLACGVVLIVLTIAQYAPK